MSREMICPKCQEDITDSYEGYDPDVGILLGGWYCSKCDNVVEENEEPDFE